MTQESIKFDNICIVMMSAVGDAVHTLPVINAIKRKYPQARITWVLQPGPATLVRGHPNVDEIIIFHRRKGLDGIKGFLEVRRELRKQKFDLVINLQVYFKAGIITTFIRSPIKLGFDRARARDGNWLFTNRKIAPHGIQHVQDQYFEFLTNLGIEHEPVEWNLGPWPHERDWQAKWKSQFTRPLASIVVATSKEQKDWMPERWAEVANVLYNDYGMQPILVGGKSEREVRAEETIMRLAPDSFSALGSGLRNLVGILDASDLVLAPDTGPLHMAIALDRPVITLMGYTNPKRTGPYRKYSDLLVDGYANPGENYVPTMENRYDRMPGITVEQVLEKIQLWDQKYRSQSARFHFQNDTEHPVP